MKQLFCILFCLLLFACGQQEDQIPDNLVPQEKMVQILADIHTAEARIENVIIYPDTAQMTFNRTKREILEQHNVTETQFRETYDYYLNNLRQMDKMYEIIIDTLSVRESKARAAQGLPDREQPEGLKQAY